MSESIGMWVRLTLANNQERFLTEAEFRGFVGNKKDPLGYLVREFTEYPGHAFLDAQMYFSRRDPSL